jgi:phosphoribosylglycinamide formyltransferase-1
MKFAVFASGNGTNLQAIIDAVKAGHITAELGMVFSNNRKAHALTRAEEAGIPTLCMERKDYTNKQSFEREIVIYLRANKIDFIVLAGYMLILSAFFIRKYEDRIINIHPSMLPAFKGKDGIKDAYTYGAKTTGVTVHFVDAQMDHGPIIMQEPVRICEGDSLEKLEEKIHKVEHRIYPKAIQLYVENKLHISGRKVKILSNSVEQSTDGEGI